MSKQSKSSTIQEKLKKRTSEFVGQYAGESDRAAVILCAARMDDLLASAIRQRLLPNSGANDELLSSDRALGTFSARINAAFRLGIIDSELSRAIHIFRKIRNDFAHQTTKAVLDDSPHRDRVTELVRPVRKSELYGRLQKSFEKYPFTEIREEFMIASCIIILALEIASETTRSVDTGNVIPFNLDPPAT